MSTKPHHQTIGKQLTIETHVDEVKITHAWHEMRPKGIIQTLRRLIRIGAVTFSINVFGIISVVMLASPFFMDTWVSVKLPWAMFFTHVVPIINVGIFYTLLARHFNSTVIKVNKQGLTISSGPIPWPGYKQFSLAELRQLYSQENPDADKRGEFPLYLTTSNLKPYKLLDKLSDQACQAVAETIEQFVIGHGQQMIPYVQRNATGVEGVTVEVWDNRLHIVSRWRCIVSFGDAVAFALGSIFGGGLLFSLVVIVTEIFDIWPTDLSVWLVIVNIWRGGIWVGLFGLLGGLLFLLLMAMVIFPLVGIYDFFVGFFNKSRIWVDSKTFEVKNGPLPYIRDKEFATANIKQLYSKKRALPSMNISYYTYDLYVITKAGHHYKLLTSAYSEQIMYLEQAIEDYLGLAAQAVRGEVGTGAVGRRKAAFAAWQELADRHRLEFSNMVDWALLSGLYRDHSLKLESIQEKNKTTLTRLTITAPQLAEVIEILPLVTIASLLPPDIANLRVSGQFQIEGQGQTITYTQIEIETNLDYLQSLFDRGCDLLEALPRIIATGGRAAPILLSIAQQKKHPLQSISHYLLSEIAQETTQRLKPNVKQLVCPNCLTYCAAHPIQNHVLKIPAYYGCRNCGQSRAFLEITGQIIAVLDHQMTGYTVRHGGNVHVNWLTQRQVGDFARIEIIQATDEEVERFVVQVANDTDPIRQPRYQTMACVVAPGCKLSENTLRILRRTFGHVEQ